MAELLMTVYSPLGEKFEVTAPNFRDLTLHPTPPWTAAPPHPDTIELNRRLLAGEVVEEATPAPVQDERAKEIEAAQIEAANNALRAEADRIAREEAQDRADAGEEEKTDETRVLKLIPADFAELSKPEVFAYIQKTFPGATIDGRAGRDTLVGRAIELANAEVNG